MTQTATEAGAIEAARQQLGLDDATAADARLVHRLDRDEDYYVIVFGDPPVAIAAVTQRGRPMSSAMLPGGVQAGGGRPALDATGARRAAGLDALHRARLVWKPCLASHSPLYPLWELTSDAGEVCYVDHAGRRWDSLPAGGPGG